MQGKWTKEHWKFQLTASQGGWLQLFLLFLLLHPISTHSLTRRLTMSGDTIVHRVLKFQLTASQGGWHERERPVCTMLYFNSQPHKEADVMFQCDRATAFPFQLTASQGGWHNAFMFNSSSKTFQLTASQGGWRQFYSIKIASFNSFL